MPYTQVLLTASQRRFVRIGGRIHSIGSKFYIPDILEHGIIRNVLVRFVVLHVLDGGSFALYTK